MFLSLYGNNNDKELRDIFNSSKFVTLTKTFGIASKDINLDNFEKEKIDNDSSIYRFTVTRDNNKDYLTVIKMNNEATVFIFEKNNLDENENGYIEQYDEKGNFLLDYRVNKLVSGKYSVVLNDFMISRRLGLDSTNKLDTVTESWVECVQRVRDVIREACKSNSVCTITCDLSASCEAYVYGLAATRCTVDRLKDRY
ncbi:hypothetical protein [Riemerella anatipestifer]|nr:hypothetical protein [Riemerella anatipestifer]ADQ81224.1 hypothetical protein Riean_0048 [Riemerella anatipestifer ATCC 11845 = DSM 15868]ADZ11292.1 hypothetical protein RIA_0097 [Riemerella anatipestifer RA-GD]AGC40889.1 hypothetical protein G148_1585 [Riemerella anatipestifer RA-CH-2]AKQ38795.1 hypothetical protein AS87_00220 [Riemerella anatipestifer Yb2]EFT35747.1 hypothetical protein RAYM_03954 [Riemerella anatipestifer RA-YM]